MADQTILDNALVEACAFAIAHGVYAVITPADFGIQRSDIGMTTATYVDASHAVTVIVDRHGRTTLGVAELYWVHAEDDEDRDICDYCEVIDGEDLAPSMTTVYLPGDAPAEVSTDV